MKKFILFTLICTLLIACNSKGNNAEELNESNSEGLETQVLEEDDKRVEIAKQLVAIGEVIEEVRTLVGVDTEEKDQLIIKKQNEIEFLDAQLERYMEIKVIKEPEEILEMYMLGLDYIDLFYREVSMHLEFLETGSDEAGKKLIEYIDQKSEMYNEYMRKAIEISKVYIESDH